MEGHFSHALLKLNINNNKKKTKEGREGGREMKRARGGGGEVEREQGRKRVSNVKSVSFTCYTFRKKEKL